MTALLPNTQAAAISRWARRLKTSDALVCPCCGQKVDNLRDPHKAVQHIHFTPLERRLIDRLIRQFGRFVPRDELVEASYVNHPDGGPLWAATSVSVRMGRLAKKLALSPLMLDSMGGPGGGRRLLWRDSPARGASA